MLIASVQRLKRFLCRGELNGVSGFYMIPYCEESELPSINAPLRFRA